MLDRLRRRLTLLYTVAALLLLLSISIGLWLVVRSYLEQVTDLALRHRMADAFRSLAAPLPDELAVVDVGIYTPAAATPVAKIDRDSAARAAILSAGGQLVETRLDPEGVYVVLLADGREVRVSAETGDVLGVGPAQPTPTSVGTALNDAPLPLAFEAEIAATYLLPLDAAGTMLFNPNDLGETPPADRDALAAALINGRDLRTVTFESGQTVRLLTYRSTRADGPAALQVGRALGDQYAMLNRLVSGLALFGTLGIVSIGFLSWWIAGRAILPAEQAWQRQQRFIAGASHELRTPLTLIRASADVALRPSRSTEDRAELLSDIVRETDHMRRLVDDLLVLTRLDSSALPLRRELLELAPWCEDLARQVVRLSAEHTITVAQPAADLLLEADADRLRQVLLILLDNAIRHTPPGGTIAVSVERAGRFARFNVADTGTGVAAEHLPHLFDPFYRVDDARQHSSNAGLGLSIAQALVQAHGGTIQIASTPGSGTHVTFTMPLARA